MNIPVKSTLLALAALLTLALTLAACQPQTLPGDPPKPLLQSRKAACQAGGGRWARGGLSGQYVCFTPLPDAGKSCTASSQCAGVCLHPSLTCQKVTPAFGCYGFLDETGQAVEICVD